MEIKETFLGRFYDMNTEYSLYNMGFFFGLVKMPFCPFSLIEEGVKCESKGEQLKTGG